MLCEPQCVLRLASIFQGTCIDPSVHMRICKIFSSVEAKWGNNFASIISQDYFLKGDALNYKSYQSGAAIASFKQRNWRIL